MILINRRLLSRRLIVNAAQKPILTTALLLSSTSPLFAQTVPITTPTPTQIPVATPNSGVLTAEGVSGDLDRDSRSPRVLIDIDYSLEKSIRILIDGEVPNKEFNNKYPIKYDIFINGRLYTSQITSKELAAPIGVEINTEEVPLPFNYTIVAELIHPNRSFKTTAYGAVTEIKRATPTISAPSSPNPNQPNLARSSTLASCTVSYSKTEQEDFVDYEVQQVSFQRGADSAITANFEALAADGKSINVSLNLTADNSPISEDEETNSETISGTVTISEEGSSPNVISSEGTVITKSSGEISELDAGDLEAETFDLFCGDSTEENIRRLADLAGSR